MNIFEIIMSAPVLLWALFLSFLTITLENLQNKNWFLPLCVTPLFALIWACVWAYNGGEHVQDVCGALGVLFFGTIVLAGAISSLRSNYDFKSAGIVSIVSFLVSLMVIALFLRDYGLAELVVPMIAISILIEGVWWDTLRKIKIWPVDPSSEVMVIPGACMLVVSWFVLVVVVFASVTKLDFYRPITIPIDSCMLGLLIVFPSLIILLIKKQIYPCLKILSQ